MSNQPPVPPPVQRPFVEPPPVVGQHPEAPRVQDAPPARDPNPRWQWWPDHPGKRVMLLSVAGWLCLLVPALVVGMAMPYTNARRPTPTSHYIVNETSLVTASEMSAMSAASGVAFVMLLTFFCIVAAAIGGVMVLAIQRKD